MMAAPQLLALGMFVFAIDSAPYSDLVRRMSWRHAVSERFMARPAGQYVGPGDDIITLGGRAAPEMGARFASFDILRTMADTGDDWPLVDGIGRVLGNFRIVSLEMAHLAIMAGGLPRAIDFTLELEAAD